MFSILLILTFTSFNNEVKKLDSRLSLKRRVGVVRVHRESFFFCLFFDICVASSFFCLVQKTEDQVRGLRSHSTQGVRLCLENYWYICI